MIIRLISFTQKGQALAEELTEKLKGHEAQAMRCGRPLSLSEWTRQAFGGADALVFVGACGIAVRAVAPYLRSKASDPAVIVIDETGRFAISLLSGHLGGANDLTRYLASMTGAQAVITTATDLRTVFAVDEWARHQNCRIPDPSRIKGFSSRLLSGCTAKIKSDYPVSGSVPAGVELTASSDCQANLSIYRPASGPDDFVAVVPNILVLGVGCKKGTTANALEQAFQLILEKYTLYAEAFCLVCSIDLKAREQGLLDFCRERCLPLKFFSPDQLKEAKGDFSSSDFVYQVTGVDNVCERCAVLGSGGTLLFRKEARNGITMAAAVKPFTPDWSWQFDPSALSSMCHI